MLLSATTPMSLRALSGPLPGQSLWGLKGDRRFLPGCRCSRPHCQCEGTHFGQSFIIFLSFFFIFSLLSDEPWSRATSYKRFLCSALWWGEHHWPALPRLPRWLGSQTPSFNLLYHFASVIILFSECSHFFLIYGLFLTILSDPCGPNWNNSCCWCCCFSCWDR